MFELQSGRLPIHWAASLGLAELTELLLSLGSPVDPTDDVSSILIKFS